MLTSLFVKIACLSSLTLAEDSENANCLIEECSNYYDGCNECFCDIEDGLLGCTLRACETNTAAYCTNCDNSKVWLATDERTSECGCPRGETISDDGYCSVTDCPDPNEELLRCNYPTNDTQCEYDGMSFRYQICQSDRSCEAGFRCDIVDEDVFYDNCTPIMCQLDADCNRYDCVDDCVGIGWGTCVKDDNVENDCPIDNCPSYYDGCNWCACNVGNGIPAICTLQACVTSTAQYCADCDNDMIWLATANKTSECECAQGEEMTDEGCRVSAECPDVNDQLLRCNFPSNDTQCEYNGQSFRYQICQDDRACGIGFRCDKVDETQFYDTCTPIMCQLDAECNTFGCIDDCVGIGWGTCVKADDVYCDIPYCLSYYDGCNKCRCNAANGLAGCTKKGCSTYTAQYCTSCDNGRIWLATDEGTSECGCPQGETISDDGYCSITDCPDASEQLLHCNYPTNDTQCEYDGVSFRYQICQDDRACEDGFRCDIVDEDVFYDTCTPIMCQLDAECNTYDCVDDCVGIGWGTCVKEESAPVIESTAVVETAPAAENEAITTDKQYCDIDYCLHSYDGCKWCSCSVEDGESTCLNPTKVCLNPTNAYCMNCDNDMVWLATDESTSECGCPQGEEMTNDGCKVTDCPDASEQLLRCNYPTNDTQCEYDGVSFRYQICQDSSACEAGYRCDKVDEDVFYDTCTPIMCQLDAECNTYDCVDDCVGIGWGTCVKDDNLCDKSIGFCISYNDGCDLDNALDECVIDVCSNMIKSNICASDTDCDSGKVCKKTENTKIAQPDVCMSLDCSTRLSICERHTCLDACMGNGNEGQLGRCVGEKIDKEQTGNNDFEAILDELNTQYDIWKANEFKEYVYSQRVDCFCLACYLETKYVTVYDDRVINSEYGTETDCDSNDIPIAGRRTMNDVFDDLIEDATEWSIKCPTQGTKTGDMCGGIGAIKCDDGFVCVDDPNDMCNVNDGGRDCSGVCVVDTDETCDESGDEQCTSGICVENICVPFDSFGDPCKYKSLDIKYDETYGYPIEVLTDEAAMAFDGGSKLYFECFDQYENGLIVNEAEKTCGYVGDFTGAYNCTCDENVVDPYCCGDKKYDNACLAQCDGINNPEEKCVKGECETGDVNGENSIGGMLGVEDRDNKLYWDLQHNYLVVIIQLVVLSLCCLSVGIAISCCGFSYNKQFKTEKQNIAMNDV